MDAFWEKFAQELLVQAMPILAVFVVGLFTKWLAQGWAWIENHKPDMAWELEHAAVFGAKVAEQVGLTGELINFADTKMDYAIELAQKQLEMRGIKNVDLSMIRAAIEKAVIENFRHTTAPGQE